VESPPTARAPRRTGALRLLAVGFALGVALVLSTGVVAERDARSSRSLCVQCHGAPASHLRGHARVACQTCHPSGPAARVGMQLARVLREGAPAGHARSPAAPCAGCHGAGSDPAAAAFATTPGHEAHARGGRAVPCVRCHGGSLHDRPVAAEACASCHAAVPMRSEPRDEASCVRCHEFSSDPASAGAALRLGVRGGAPRVDGGRVHGAVDCRQCHNPHRDPVDPAAPTAAGCTGCHRGDIAAQVAAGPEGHRTCLGCHAVHADRLAGTPQCDRCHLAPQRAGPAVVPAAPGLATNALRTWLTRPDARPPAVPDAAWQRAAATPANPGFTHGGRCASCHRPHTWVARPTDCRTCHAAQAAAVAFDTPHGINGCVGCHDPHGPRPDSGACGACHQPEARLARAAPPEPHRACLSCHQPHAAARPTAVVCATCHVAQRDRVAAGPAAHVDCTACHAPHGPPRPATPAACASCHAPVTAWFASTRHPARHTCEGCHADHDFSRPTARAACQRCHQELASHRGSHLGDCVSCHAPHPPAPQRELADCRACHASPPLAGPPTMQAGHQRCEGCHRPHEAPARAAAQCATCHRPEAAVAPTWPAGSPHAGACVQCHAPHRPAEPIAACATCHAAQATPNHTGRHPRCVMCHAPHRERPSGGGAAWWTRCADCHRAEATAAAAPTTSATHRACANCHQRPGLAPPTCVSCHGGIPTQLMHAVPQHANCTQCHERHGNAPPTRSRCVACHADRTTHFPDAPTCQACHPFASGAPRP
jgi:hypothetical protein